MRKCIFILLLAVSLNTQAEMAGKISTITGLDFKKALSVFGFVTILPMKS